MLYAYNGEMLSREKYFNPRHNLPTPNGLGTFGIFVSRMRSLFVRQDVDIFTVPEGWWYLSGIAQNDLSMLAAFIYKEAGSGQWELPVFKRSGSAVMRSHLRVRDSEWAVWSNEQRSDFVKQLADKLSQANIQGYSVAEWMFEYDSWNSQLIRWLVGYDMGWTVFANDYNNYNAFTLLDKMERDPDKELVLEFEGGGGYIDFRLTERFDGPAVFKKYAKVYGYSTDVYKELGGKPFLLKDQKGEIPLYGVELELNCDVGVAKVISAFEEPFALCKNDSSVSGKFRYNYELVTVPASLKAHRVMWTRFFKNSNLDKFDTSLRTSNGMHVHVGRTHFEGSPHVLRFSYFFNNLANRWFIVEMSERDEGNIRSYCNFANLHDIKTKGKQFTDVVKIANANKMYAVNMTKSATIEVRIFKGVVSFASVMKNIELVDAVLEYTRQCSIQQCDVKGLMDWLHGQPKSSYRALRMYLEKYITIETIDRLTSISKGDPREIPDLTHRERRLLARGDRRWKEALFQGIDGATDGSSQFSDALLSSRKAV